MSNCGQVNPAILRRFDDALNFRKPDRVPVWEMLQHPAAFSHFAPGVPFPECAAIACERLRIDATYGFFDVPAEGTQRPDGVVIAGQTEWHATPLFGSLADLQEWRPPKIDTARLAEEIPAYHARMQALCGWNLLYLPQDGGFEFIPGYDADTFLVFSEAMAGDLPALERFWDCQAELARARNAVTAGHIPVPAVQCCIDVACNTGLMVSPDLLRKHFFPRFAQVIAPLKEAGIKVIWHSDGDISTVLDDAIAIGVDGIDPVDPAAAHMDMGALKQRYGRSLVFVGNVGLDHVLRFGTPDQVRADVRRCLRQAGLDGGLILQCGDGQIMPDCPLENVIAYLDEAHAGMPT